MLLNLVGFDAICHQFFYIYNLFNVPDNISNIITINRISFIKYHTEEFTNVRGPDNKRKE